MIYILVTKYVRLTRIFLVSFEFWSDMFKHQDDYLVFVMDQTERQIIYFNSYLQN